MSNVDYSQWLKIYNSELSTAHPGVSLRDVDPRYVQSLFQKDLDPAEAAKLGVVYREESEDAPPFSFSHVLDRVQWDYVVGAAGILMLVALLLGPRIVARIRGAHKSQVVASQGHTGSNGDFYASDEINIPATTTETSSSTPSGLPVWGRQEIPWPSAFGDLGPITQSYPMGTFHSTVRHSTVSVASLSAGDQPVHAVGQRSSANGGSASTSGSSPVIDQFDVTTTSTNDQGLTGTVTWNVSNADAVQILLLGVPISGVTDTSGSIPFDSLAAGSIFTIRAIGGGHVVEDTAAAEPN